MSTLRQGLKKDPDFYPPMRRNVQMFKNNPGTAESQGCYELETAETPVSLSTVKPTKKEAAQMDKPNTF